MLDTAANQFAIIIGANKRWVTWTIFSWQLGCHQSCEKLGLFLGGACGVMVIVVGIGYGDTSSNPGLITFHIALIPLGKVWIQLFSLQLWVNSRAD